jgi:hypothetical protein
VFFRFQLFDINATVTWSFPRLAPFSLAWNCSGMIRDRGRSAQALSACLLACAFMMSAAARARPVVLELFTSQACSSCPPADALLAELARRPDVIALDLHVDYWNGPGWRDPYSMAEFSARQQHYATLLGDSEVYTPELVVDGRRGVVGSDREAVEAAIDAARADNSVGIRLRRAGDGLTAEIEAGGEEATLWLAGIASSRTTRIGGGENGGRTLTEANVVLSLAPVASLSGAAQSLHLVAPAGDRAIVFLQAAGGDILGAASL